MHKKIEKRSNMLGKYRKGFFFKLNFKNYNVCDEKIHQMKLITDQKLYKISELEDIAVETMQNLKQRVKGLRKNKKPEHQWANFQ